MLRKPTSSKSTRASLISADAVARSSTTMFLPSVALCAHQLVEGNALALS